MGPREAAPAAPRLRDSVAEPAQEKQSCRPLASTAAETPQCATCPSGRDRRTPGGISWTGRCSAACADGQHVQLGQGTSGVSPAGSDSMGSVTGCPGGRSLCLVTTGRVVRGGRQGRGEAGLGAYGGPRAQASCAAGAECVPRWLHQRSAANRVSHRAAAGYSPRRLPEGRVSTAGRHVASDCAPQHIPMDGCAQQPR